jgi:cyclase
MHRILLAGATGAALLVACSADAQQPIDFSKVEIQVTDVGKGIYMLAGQGGNIVVVVGSDGMIVVDNEFAELYDKIKAAITKLSSLPVKYVINTHFHRDHTGGNELFNRDGAIIVAHENVRTRLASGSRNNVSGNMWPPAPAAALPTITYQDTITLRLKDRTAELRHPANVHTDGDTYLQVPEANVLIAGDLVFFARYPNIDYLYGGSIDGQIRGADELLALVNDDTAIVPGHGPVGTKAMLRDYRQMLADARERIQKLKAAGKSEEQVFAARPNADYDAKFGPDAKGENFMRAVFRSLPIP